MKPDDIRIVTIYSPIGAKMLKEIHQVFFEVFENMLENITKSGGFRPGWFETVAYDKCQGRYFKHFIKLRVFPEIDISRQDITEITKKEYKDQIAAKKDSNNPFSGYIQIDTD